LQDIENYAAKLEMRQPMNVISERYETPGLHGYFSYDDKLISISEADIMSNDIGQLRNTVNTIMHEGRHAYQYSNVKETRTELSDEKFESWRMNLEEVGYLDASVYGFELYATQPVEVDARVFAEAVTKDLTLR
jgi:hypothetical protein